MRAAAALVVLLAFQPQAVLELAQPPVGIMRSLRAACVEQAEACGQLEQGKVPDVAGQLGVSPGVAMT